MFLYALRVPQNQGVNMKEQAGKNANKQAKTAGAPSSTKSGQSMKGSQSADTRSNASPSHRDEKSSHGVNKARK
jgi:hypothetical protein